MKILINFFTWLSISISAFVSGTELSIAEINQNNVIRKLTSNDWISADANNKFGCLIDIDKLEEIIPSSPPKIFSGCTDYTYQEWKRVEALSDDIHGSTYRLLYGDSLGNTCTRDFILPVIEEYNELPIIPSYIDVNSFKNKFIQSILLRHTSNASVEAKQGKENDLYFIQRGDFPKIRVKLTDYNYPRGGGHFQNAIIYLSKKTKTDSI